MSAVPQLRIYAQPAPPASQRGIGVDAADRATHVAERLRAHGFPNYFGDQRFGREGETLQLGLDLLRGLKTPGDISRARRKFLLRLALSAAQSALFNAALAGRLAAGRLLQVMAGDVLQVTASHGLFVCENAEIDQPRFEQGEVVPTGPLFGPKMIAPQHEVAAAEAELLERELLTRSMFEQYASLTSGARRAFLVRPDDLSVTTEGDCLRVEVTLPSGTYATVLLREFQKE